LRKKGKTTNSNFNTVTLDDGSARRNGYSSHLIRFEDNRQGKAAESPHKSSPNFNAFKTMDDNDGRNKQIGDETPRGRNGGPKVQVDGVTTLPLNLLGNVPDSSRERRDGSRNSFSSPNSNSKRESILKRHS